MQTRPTTDEHAFRQATEKVLWELASGPGGVVLGRAGAVILASCPDALHLRLDGPAASSAERAALEEGIDQATAPDQLNQTDRARAAYVRHLYGRDLRDPALYDLVIDSTSVSLNACLDAILAVATGSADGAASKPYHARVTETALAVSPGGSNRSSEDVAEDTWGEGEPDT